MQICDYIVYALFWFVKKIVFFSYTQSISITMSKKKKSSVLVESDSDDSDSGKDLDEVTRCCVMVTCIVVHYGTGYGTVKTLLWPSALWCRQDLASIYG